MSIRTSPNSQRSPPPPRNLLRPIDLPMHVVEVGIVQAAGQMDYQARRVVGALQGLPVMEDLARGLPFREALEGCSDRLLVRLRGAVHAQIGLAELAQAVGVVPES